MNYAVSLPTIAIVFFNTQKQQRGFELFLACSILWLD